ncbi:unnamed protein product [Acanthoscelides obtectus]|uniref:Uncharacterized protein n=1 Tax=Acanthoscelides obtectus TaxID=200917 RepID=A0A9P0L772_ACAOB|nr:unnamed protein product [Acanthoscelides obtectus]CAK1629566.1 hypothetical protein AOBTE_LOCUS5819 [Acanthoscelides obtectus]
MSLEINGCGTAENKLNNYFIKSATDIVSTIPSSNEEAIMAAVPLEEEFLSATSPTRHIRNSLCRLVHGRREDTQERSKIASNVEPPVAHKYQLAELGTIGAQERRLSSVYVTIMPTLATRFCIGEESWIRLLVTVEVGIRHCA